MITSKLTTKAQTTIPQPVRAALRLKEGDALAYEIRGDRVILTKAKAGAIDDPFAAFGEWDSEADRAAYAEALGRAMSSASRFPMDRSTRQRRPALVVSKGGIGEGNGLLWVAMITSAESRAWPGDVPLGEHYREAGLPAPSVIRPCKLATIEPAMPNRSAASRQYVFAQDVNLTKPGTPPVIAAQHIGGFFIASAIEITFDPTLPCPLKAQATITVV